VPHSDELDQTLVVWRPTGAATWWTLSKYNAMWFWPTGRMLWKHDVLHKRSYLFQQCYQRKTSRQHAQKFSEDWPGIFWVMWVKRQTDWQTYSSQYQTPLPGVKITKKLICYKRSHIGRSSKKVHYQRLHFTKGLQQQPKQPQRSQEWPSL